MLQRAVTSTERRALADVRMATPADDAGCRALAASVGMDAELQLALHRRPTMDALYRLHASAWESWVVELEGRVEGMGAVLARDGWLGGERRRIGYLGDLRFSPAVQGRQLLDRFYAPVLKGAAERLGCDLFLTAVIASNDRAMRALTVRTRRSARNGRPLYTPLRDFAIRSLHLLLPAPHRRHHVTVRPATDADIPRLAALLDGDARRRPFGYVLDEGELRRRLREWPGLSVNSFLLAERGDGSLAGGLALWDADPVKRTIVHGYRGAMRRTRLVHDLAARVLRAPRLPAPGGALHYLYATHVAVPDDDPRVLSALLDAAHATARRAGYQFLSVFAPAGDPLAPAWRGRLTTDLPARLYVVTLDGHEPPPACFDGARPGFEMALV
jgi:hypothetical protein